MTLGMYEGFPESIQKIAFFTAAVSYKRLQQALIEVFHRLNTETLQLEDIGSPSIHQCRVAFEFGMANAQTFNYLDDKQAREALNSIQEKPFSIMDFLCAIRYHKLQNHRQTPLRFDYYMLRLKFNRNVIELRIFHERGSMHVSPEEIADFVKNRINASFPRKVLKTVETD